MEQYSIEKAARKILEKNTKTGQKNGRTYTFSAPSLSVYPFQWTGWDSQFHTIVWTRLGNIERAKQELESIFAWQEKNPNSEYYGFIPHMAFYEDKKVRRSPFHDHYLESRGRWSFLPFTSKPKSSAFLQPPVLARAFEYVWEATQDKDFLKKYLGSLELYYRWFKNKRDPDNDDLISVISQFETGADYSPTFDLLNGFNIKQSYLRLKIVTRIPSFYNKWFFNYNLKAIFKYTNYHFEDVLVNSIYADGLYALSRLAQEAQDKNLENWAKEQAERTKKALIRKCYDKDAGLFWDLLGKDEKPSKAKTIISLMPLILPDLPQDIVKNLVRHLSNEKEFLTSYPIATVSRDEETFLQDTQTLIRDFIWRGPSTMNMNWFLVHALRQYGYNDIAESIVKKSREMVEHEGFWEFYDPITGKGIGAPDFGWATLIVDM